MSLSLEKYLDHLDNIVGIRGEYHLITAPNESPAVWAIVYRDTPEIGNLTAFSFGLSSVKHPDWRLGRPELVVSVNSSNMNWGLAIGFLVRRFRGKSPFSYGNVIRFDETICDESAMSAFLICLPTILEPDQSKIKLDKYTINIVQAYPIYEEEVAIIEQIGAQKFFMQDSIDFCDVRREMFVRPT